MDFIIRLLKRFSGYKQLSSLMAFAKPLTYKEFCVLGAEVAEFRFEFNQYWQGLNLDAAICPIWPLVAPLHESTVKIAPAFSYSFFWNLLDFPAGVVPIKLVEKGEDIYRYHKNDSYIKVAQEIMKNSEGLPVCLQVVGCTYQDEKVLRVMKIVQDLYKFHKIPLLAN